MKIDVKNLVFGYSDTPLLNGLDLQLAPGGILWIAGVNGGGKSTLLKLLSGYLRCQSGNIMLDGKDLRTLSGDFRARHIGVAAQTPVPALDFTVYEMTALACSAILPRLGAVPPMVEKTIFEALEYFELSGKSSTPVNLLSGGERQRVTLAGLYALQPEIMLLDEATSALDPRHRKLAMGFLRQYSQEHTVAMVTHDFDLLAGAQASDRILFLAEGGRAYYGTPDELLTDKIISEVYQTPAAVSSSAARRKIEFI